MALHIKDKAIASARVKELRVFLGIHNTKVAGPTLMGQLVSAPACGDDAVLGAILHSKSAGERQMRYTAVLWMRATDSMQHVRERVL